MTEENNTEGYYPKQNKWVKALFILVVLIGYSFSEALLWCLSIFQFLWVIVRRQPNEYVEDFGTNLINWNRLAISYCLWKTDTAPFPFSRWSNDNF